MVDMVAGAIEEPSSLLGVRHAGCLYDQVLHVTPRQLRANGQSNHITRHVRVLCASGKILGKITFAYVIGASSCAASDI